MNPRDEGRGARAEGQGPRAEGRGARDEGRGPRAEGQGTRGKRRGQSAEDDSAARTRLTVTGFEDLIVWQRSIALVRTIYRITSRFPSDERYGLTSQIRRASVSIPSNIAEGHERNSTREYIHFVSTAEGSLAEVRTQLRIALELGYCDVADVQPVNSEITEIKRMLNALRRSLNAKA